MKNVFAICAVTLTVPLAGCGLIAPSPVQPSDITVEKALTSVGDGLAGFKKQLDQNDMKLGLYVDTINIELDLTTDKKGDGKLSVDFSKGLQLGPQLGMEQSVDASRGSKLTITLKQAMVPAKGAQQTSAAGKDAGETNGGGNGTARNGNAGSGAQGTVSVPSEIPFSYSPKAPIFSVPSKTLGSD